MEGLPWFILILFVVVVVVTMLWELLKSALASGLEWVFCRLGLSGPSQSRRKGGDQEIGSVLEPFTLESAGVHARGKVQFHGEIWNAVCDPALASSLKKGDSVEVKYGEELSLTVQNKLEG